MAFASKEPANIILETAQLFFNGFGNKMAQLQKELFLPVAERKIQKHKK
jgi:hypothetical protein